MANEKQQWLDPAGLDKMLADVRAKTDILYAPRVGTESTEGAQQKADAALQSANEYTDQKIKELEKIIAISKLANVEVDDKGKKVNLVYRDENGNFPQEMLSGGVALIPIVLTVDGWVENNQTVAVERIVADETKQLIQPLPASVSKDVYDECNIQCIAQNDGSLTFSCDNIPAEDVNLFITIQMVGNGTPGDMLTSVYDPQGKATDVFEYVDQKISEIPTPDVSGQINTHNENPESHSDIRKSINDHIDANNPHGITPSMISNPNLLDNWYFADPIDQRGGYVVPPNTPYSDLDWKGQVGVTDTYYPVKRWHKYTNLDAIIEVDGVEYVVNYLEPVRGYTNLPYHTYIIDRWFVTSKPLTVLLDSNGLKMNDPVGAGQFRQTVENIDGLRGKEVTFSVLVNITTEGLFKILLSEDGGSTYIGGKNINTVGIHLLQYTATVPNNYNMLNVCIEPRTTNANVIAAKLELGDTQTLAHQDTNGNWVLNDSIPNKQQELAKCQRTYIRGEGWHYAYAGGTMSSQIIHIDFPVTMRAMPVITLLRGNNIDQFTTGASKDGFYAFKHGDTTQDLGIYEYEANADL